MVSLKSAIHFVSYTLTLTPDIAVPAFLPQWNVCDVVKIHKRVCAGDRMQTVLRGWKVPCLKRWTTALGLWPVKGIFLSVWADMDVPECGWGERGCEGAGTYFKAWLFVLVKAHGDSSNTGDLSWTQPSSETGEVSSYTPSLMAPGPLGLLSCSACPVYRADWSHAFYFNLLFSSAPLCFSLCFSVFFALSLCPPKNRRSAAWLPGKRRATPLSLSLPLCQLYLNKYGLSWALILKTAASILEESKGCMFRQQGPPKVPIQLLPPHTHTQTHTQLNALPNVHRCRG